MPLPGHTSRPVAGAPDLSGAAPQTLEISLTFGVRQRVCGSICADEGLHPLDFA